METRPTPSPPSHRYPSRKQVLVMVVGGLVLAVTACAGFFASLSGNFERGGDAVLTPLAAILFCVGVLAFVVGLVMLLVRVVRGARDRSQPPPSGAP